MCVHRGQRAETRAEEHERAFGGSVAPRFREQLVREGVCVARRCRVELVASGPGRKEQRAELRSLAEGDEVVEQLEERRVARVLGAVVDDQQWQRLPRVGLRR